MFVRFGQAPSKDSGALSMARNLETQLAQYLNSIQLPSGPGVIGYQSPGSQPTSQFASMLPFGITPTMLIIGGVGIVLSIILFRRR